jgi:hypothetical protein
LVTDPITKIEAPVYQRYHPSHVFLAGVLLLQPIGLHMVVRPIWLVDWNR